jgi:hypothetical protein
MGKCFRYVPLYELPPGTVVEITTSDDLTPAENVKSSKWVINDGDLEKDSRIELPGGEYRLTMEEWGCTTISYEDGVTEHVRPLYRVVAPTSTFTANVDRGDAGDSTTFRLVTGAIESIYLPQAGIRLHKKDGVTDFTSNRRRSRKHSTRGTKYV